MQYEDTPLGDELPVEFGVEHLYIDLSEDRVRALAQGQGRGLRELALEIDEALAAELQGIERDRTRAASRDDPFETIALMTVEYSAKRLAALVTPQVEGDRMWVDVPLSVPEMSTMLTAVGVGSLLVVREFARIGVRQRTSEAKVQLAKLFDASASYFKSEMAGGGPNPLHRCPNDGRPKGESGVTPPLSVECAKGPNGNCVPLDERNAQARGPGYYDMDLWTSDPVWSGLNFVQEMPHQFHYNFIWDNDVSDGYGTCVFTIQAFADLDDDGIYSTFERSGLADRNGVAAPYGLFVDRELE